MQLDEQMSLTGLRLWYFQDSALIMKYKSNNVCEPLD